MSLMSLDDALVRLLAGADAYLLTVPHAARTPASVPLSDALGRVLATDIASTISVPSVDNSAMDGYALRAADVVAGGPGLVVSQRIAAGQVPTPLEAGTVARIFTGAQIPDGADTVVMQEDVRLVDSLACFDAQPQAGAHVRGVGCDIMAGSTILKAGDRLGAAHIALAASTGLDRLPVWPRVRVATFSTGDELVMPGEPLAPGKIYNSNRFLLRGLLAGLDVTHTDLGIVEDSLAATREVLRRAAVDHDLIVTTGGVSVGEEDHVRPAVEAEGHIDLWALAIKPGKPLAFGAISRQGDVGEALFIGLPGNPVSSLITFALCVRPVLLRLAGVADVSPVRVASRADFTWARGDRRREFLRARRNAQGGLDLFSNQLSAVLTSTVWADGIVDNPPGQTIAPGDTVQFIAFSDLLS
jgi:molybdopterin molybdotransferase